MSLVLDTKTPHEGHGADEEDLLQSDPDCRIGDRGGLFAGQNSSGDGAVDERGQRSNDRNNDEQAGA